MLIGIAEAYNGGKGLSIDPPRLIGNPQLAQRVMEGGSGDPIIGVSTAGYLAATAALRLVDSGKDAA